MKRWTRLWASVGQDNDSTVIVGEQGLEGLGGDVGGGAIPIGQQVQLVEYDAELSATGRSPAASPTRQQSPGGSMPRRTAA
jgi:hypothetical protein